MTRAFAGWCGALFLALAFAAHGQEPLPVPKPARVIDQSGVLDGPQKAGLEAKLAAFERERGSQVAVLLVPTLGQETIEEFAGRVADQWKLGREGIDDGVLFVVAMQDRKMRIHTGRGVQGTLTDALSKRIVSDLVAPRFRAGDFAGGIETGVDAILRAIEGEALPLPAKKAAPRDGGMPSYATFLFLAFFLVPVVAGILRRMFGRFFGATATSGLMGAAGWFLVGSIAFGLVAAFLAFVIALFSGMGVARSVSRGGWGGTPIPGSWGGGSWGGGGGGFGGGGFSGGGGGFDGGGASGSW